MPRYYLTLDEELAARLKEVDNEAIRDVLEALVDDQGPPADEVDHEELSEAERERRRLRRIRRRRASGTERPQINDE